ncbi:MAG: 4-hydroxy-3-methylbut-2-enyl diphosphate reductase [Bosea sp. (in: a-proteobacteria)]|uniref:4-hydroxy-3-methylbut-2-enyl diphosphate reductase n=1 Tax=Bosea sp. (in: a-proteobacteria) TaxID=1871050 RepID=UPI0027338237|nr:4-hydroxy-3-methylbut-2-enyl diphosphate reductase [Bosea sp. (in: a-proteobacteria)]MDP3600387.1 4-hydroxy-3-methylbut-2-enyl diphosphate reductase [Bosea sp. (in: a-proteobacteria)]
MNAVTPFKRPLTVLLAKPRGFCAGVVRAVEIVERAIAQAGAPVYVRHEIVHNTHVVEGLRAQGAVFVGEVDQIPAGATTIFSAHGVSRGVEAAAAARGLDVIDATCPLVQKVHNQGRRYAQLGYDVVLIGHEGHAEVEGTRGQIDGRLHVVATAAEVASLVVADPEKVAYISQTTLSVQDTREVIVALTARFPAIVGPDIRNICYATQNRQAAVQAMAPHCDLILVVGSRSSSNTTRLREVGEIAGVASHLIEGPDAIDPAWFEAVETVGFTAGASAPERLIQDAIDRLRGFRSVTVRELEGVDEEVVFRLPPRLVEAMAS